jgi:hypothetical protein
MRNADQRHGFSTAGWPDEQGGGATLAELTQVLMARPIGDATMIRWGD